MGTIRARNLLGRMNNRPRISLIRSFAWLTAILLLAGCGAEVAGGAAAVGGLQAQQLQQARQQQAQVVDGLKAAQAAGMARAASAGD